MRKLGTFAKPWTALLLVLAFVHAWTPRALWHWHDCGSTGNALTQGCAASCTHVADYSLSSLQTSATAVWASVPDSDCDFSFSGLHLPPLGPLSWGLLVLLALGRLRLGSLQPAWLVPVAAPARTGRAPPRGC